MSVQVNTKSVLPTPVTGPDALRRSGALFALLGGILCVLGVMAVGAAFITTLTTVIVFGALVLVGGVVELINSLWARAWRGFFLHLMAGVLYAVVGLFMMAHPGPTAAGITLMVAASLVVGGLIRMLVSAVDRFDGWIWSLASGIVAALLGIMIWRQWPASGLWVMGLFIGIDLIVNGWTWIMLALALKKLRPSKTGT